jgi:hypothetical protein
MYLAYFDESGDTGLVNSPTRFFVLSCALVHEKRWLETLDGLVKMRVKMRQQHGISPRPEIKATDIRRGQGPLLALRWSLARRMTFYQNIMRYQASALTGMAVFAVAINKAGAHAKGREPREVAWEFALQRVNRFCEDDDERAMLFPDEGHFPFIRHLIRRMRRFQYVPRRWGGGSFSAPATRVVEDPNDRTSGDSYFIQLADWNAYAAHRSSYIDPVPAVTPDLVNTGVELHTFTGQHCTLWGGVGASRQVAAASFARERERAGGSDRAAARGVPRARWSSAWWRIR